MLLCRNRACCTLPVATGRGMLPLDPTSGICRENPENESPLMIILGNSRSLDSLLLSCRPCLVCDALRPVRAGTSARSPGAATRACPYGLPAPNLPPPAGVLGSPLPRVRLRVRRCASPGLPLLLAFVYLQSCHSSFIRSILPLDRGSVPVRSYPRPTSSRSYAPWVRASGPGAIGPGLRAS